MQKLKLTKKKETLLLEICAKLFPEYKNIWVYRFQDPLYHPEHVQFFKKDKEKPKTFSIHWFELCLLHIAPKLADLIQQAIDEDTDEDDPIEYKYDWSEWCTSEGVVSCIFHYMNQDNMHPIDILYKEFKLLKLK